MPEEFPSYDSLPDHHSTRGLLALHLCEMTGAINDLATHVHQLLLGVASAGVDDAKLIAHLGGLQIALGDAVCAAVEASRQARSKAH